MTIVDTNVSTAARRANVIAAMKRAARHFKPAVAHARACILVGGGPSVQNELFMIAALSPEGEIFAVNGVPRYLAERGIEPDIHVLMDAMPEVEAFVSPHIRMIRYYASQCEPMVLDMAGKELILWHAASNALDDVPGVSDIVGGGSTTATRAIYLAYGLGYRNFHLFGFDSSFEEGKQHAYKQVDHPTVVEVSCGDETFKSSPPMIAQAVDFQLILPEMVNAGCSVTVHGSGLLRAIANDFLKPIGV